MATANTTTTFEPTVEDSQIILDGKITLDFIIDFCQRAGEVEWLKATCNTPIKKAVYPKKMNANGRMVSDKKATPTFAEVKPTFMDIREAFLIEFFGKSPKKQKKSVSMIDKINAL